VQVLLDLIGPDRDTRPPRPETPPERPYIVCSTPRSGSGLLCRAIAAANIAGSPLEYFNPVHRSRLADRWGCGPSLGAYMRALYALRTTPGGVFGAKLHWDQFVALRAETLGLPVSEPGYEVSAEFLERLLPGVAYVRIIRRDVNRQAISLWFALHTGIWSVAASDSGDGGARARVPYSFAGIERCRRLIENAELHWDRFLRFNGCVPVDVVYEDLVARYAAEVECVLRAVAPGTGPVSIPAVRATRRLSDGRSEEFLERLAHDRAARGMTNPVEFVRS
jgi:trehalose 2-sulfotransferase